MDGSVSLFPQNDYSAIYAKTWTKDGTIATVKYVPEHGKTWESLVDGNVWEPGAQGSESLWKEVIE